MNKLFILLEVMLQIFASWTLAYHLLLLLRWPARLIVIPFLLIWLPMLALSLRGWGRKIQASKRTQFRQEGEPWFLPCVFILALSAGIFTLVVSRPDADDFSFFHRALLQLSHLDMPFFLTDTAHNVPDLPALSLSHLMTSYEPLVAMASAAIGIDPLNAYQNLSAFIVGAMLSIVYVLLYRLFRLDNLAALGATACALVFLILDGNLHRSFGNFALIRCWQGKSILITLLVPATYLLVWRFLISPSWQRFSLVLMVNICAVGLSGSGMFLLPALVFAISIAYLFSHRFSPGRLKRVLILNCASFYPAAIAIGFLSGILHQPIDTSIWIQEWPAGWLQNLSLVIGDSPTLIRNLLILLALPLISLRGPLGRHIALVTIVLCLMFANPLLGPVWMKVLHPGAYWRIAYLFPLPWCSGLIANRAVLRDASGRRLIRIGSAIIIFISVIHAYQFSVLPAGNSLSVRFKAPWELKFPPQELKFANSVLKHVSNKNILAPEEIVVVLGLLDPGIKFEAGRPAETLHIFCNAGRGEEGQQRIAVQRLVSACADSNAPDDRAAFLRTLETGINAVILRDCGPDSTPASIRHMKLDSCEWEEAENQSGYILLLRKA